MTDTNDPNFIIILLNTSRRIGCSKRKVAALPIFRRDDRSREHRKLFGTSPYLFRDPIGTYYVVLGDENPDPV